MTFSRATAIAASFFAMALVSVAQTGSTPPPARTGFDISGLGPDKPESPTGEKPMKRPKGPTEITAHDALFDSRDYLATFTTEVRVTDPEFGLSCDRLTVNMKKPVPQGTPKPAEKSSAKTGAKGDANSGIERAVAEGNVIITQDKKEVGREPEQYEGRGRRAVFENKTGTLTLTGRPRIAQSVNGAVLKEIITLEDSAVITLHRSGKIEVKGLFKSTLRDAADLNQNASR